MNYPGLTFDETGHVYRMRGLRIPSVTQVLDGALRDFSKIPPATLELARERGSLIHEATAFDARGVLDENSVDEDIVPYVEAWRLFMRESGAEIVATEEVLYHPLYGMAGRCDHVIILNDTRVMLDKKSAIPDDADQVQTSAYAEMWNYQAPSVLRVCKRAALYLRPTGKYALVYHRSKADFPTFLSALQIYKRKMQTTKELT